MQLSNVEMDGPPPKKSKFTNSPSTTSDVSSANSEYWNLLNDVNSKLPDELDTISFDTTSSYSSQINETNHNLNCQISEPFNIPSQLLLQESPSTKNVSAAVNNFTTPISFPGNLSQIVRYSTTMHAVNNANPSPIILAANGQSISSNRLQFVASSNRLMPNVIGSSGGIRTVVSNGNRSNMMAIMMPNKLQSDQASNIVMLNGKPNTSMVWTTQGVAIVGSDALAGNTSGAQRLITLQSRGMQKFVVINNSGGGGVTSCNATPIIQIARPQQAQVSKLRGVLANNINQQQQQQLLNNNNNNSILQHNTILQNLQNNPAAAAIQNNSLLQNNVHQGNMLQGGNLINNNILQNASVALLQNNNNNAGLLQNQTLLQNSSILTNNFPTPTSCNNLISNLNLQQSQTPQPNAFQQQHSLILNTSLSSSSSPSSISSSQSSTLFQQQSLLQTNLNNAQQIQQHLQQQKQMQIQQQQQLQQQLQQQQKLQQLQQLQQPHLSPTPIFSPTSGQMAADPEKRKLIRHQLVLLLHAHKCQKREQQANGSIPPCKLSHCQTMKGVLNHISECQEGKMCKVPHCASSRQIINHWRTCQRPDCGVCYPLRRVTQPPLSNPTINPEVTTATLPQQPTPDMSKAYRLLGLQPPPTQIVTATATTTTTTTANIQQPIRNGLIRANLDKTGGCGGGLILQQSITTGGTAQLPSSSSCLLPARLPGGLNGAEPRPAKAWHQSITQDLRNHLVQKLVQAIFPSPDISLRNDVRINSLIQYSRKVEGDMYETADSQEHYYHLLAEKIYRIQKELEEKKLKRQQKSFSDKQILDTGTSKDSSMEATNSNNSQTNASDCADSSQPSVDMTSEYADVSLQPIKKEEQAGEWEEDIKVEPVNEEVLSEIKTEEKLDVKPLTKPATKIIWKPLELRQNLLPTLEKLYRLDESSPFRLPVDPILLNIPDYFDIIKNPMDMSTIKRKLDTGAYSDPWDYVNDIWLMFENAWLYNRKSSRVHKHATKMSEVFESEIDVAMKGMGYCCGRKYVFNPQALFCYGKSTCTIPINAVYYSHQNRYVFCEKCYLEAIGDELELSDDPLQPNIRIRKDLFEKTKNNQLELEPLVECTMCGRRQHQICALYFEPVYYASFICKHCSVEHKIKLRENKFTAKRLPQTKLGTFLENRVNGFLKKNCESAGEVTIRMLSSSEKNADVKPLMKARFGNELPESFPYIAKSIFAFEEIEGVDVCFFGMHVQEYGSNCPNPNSRHMYLAYLDSVNLFQPRIARTAVYHELLIGYFDYVKKLGYATVHIWACPPSEGDDYIFHCHPPDMKIPKPKRLQDWYRKMLDKATNERVVVEYKDILKDALESNMTTPLEMPYFEGDFWPTVLEDNIRELQEEEERMKKEEGVVPTLGLVAAASTLNNNQELNNVEETLEQEEYADSILTADKKKGQKGMTKKKKVPTATLR